MLPHDIDRSRAEVAGLEPRRQEQISAPNCDRVVENPFDVDKHRLIADFESTPMFDVVDVLHLIAFDDKQDRFVAAQARIQRIIFAFDLGNFMVPQLIFAVHINRCVVIRRQSEDAVVRLPRIRQNLIQRREILIFLTMLENVFDMLRADFLILVDVENVFVSFQQIEHIKRDQRPTAVVTMPAVFCALPTNM